MPFHTRSASEMVVQEIHRQCYRCWVQSLCDTFHVEPIFTHDALSHRVSFHHVSSITKTVTTLEIVPVHVGPIVGPACANPLHIKHTLAWPAPRCPAIATKVSLLKQFQQLMLQVAMHGAPEANPKHILRLSIVPTSHAAKYTLRRCPIIVGAALFVAPTLALLVACFFF